MAFAQYPPVNQHIINVNHNSKWVVSDSPDAYPEEIDNSQVDASVPGSWKANNGTCCWDRSDRVPPMTRPMERVPVPGPEFNPAVGAPPPGMGVQVQGMQAAQPQPHPQQPRTQAQMQMPPQIPSLVQACTSTLLTGARSVPAHAQAPARQAAPVADGVPIEIHQYNPQWAIEFEAEANQIQAILGPDIVVQIYHIGSTSIPGLPAKPIIDMIPVVKNILAMDTPICRSKMEALGYEYKGELGIPFRRYYTKDDSSPSAAAASGMMRRRTHHLHVYQIGNPEIEHHLQFRNYLSSQTAQQNNDFRKYAQLKMELAARYPSDMRSYSLGKSNFINSLQTRINFGGILIRNCETQEEWNGYRKLMRRSQIGGGEGDEKMPNHYQFVLQYGAQVVCAAHVILDKTNGYFQILDIQADENWIGQGFEQKMEHLVLQWRNHQQFLAQMESERNGDLDRHFVGLNLAGGPQQQGQGQGRQQYN